MHSSEYTRALKRQQGSTVLGVVVGVVLGLVVALAVSLYLANTGAPIQQKAPKDNAPAEIVANPVAKVETPTTPAIASKTVKDPNESLYAKPPKVDASDVTAEVKADPKVDTKTDAKKDKTDVSQEPKTKPDTKPDTKPELDAIGKIASVVTPVKPASTGSVANATPSDSIQMPKPAIAAPGSERYFVQVGAYASVNEADAVRAKVALLGVNMVLSPRDKEIGRAHV